MIDVRDKNKKPFVAIIGAGVAGCAAAGALQDYGIVSLSKAWFFTLVPLRFVCWLFFAHDVHLPWFFTFSLSPSRSRILSCTIATKRRAGFGPTTTLAPKVCF